MEQGMEKTICEVLSCYGHFKDSLHDDTLLEKFENFLQSQWLSQKDQYDADKDRELEDGVRDFVSAVIASNNAQPEKLVLALKLESSLLSQCNKEFPKDPSALDMKSNQFLDLMDKCLKTDYWGDPSVRNAWLHAVASLIHIKPFLDKIATNPRLIRTIVSAVDDSSLFVVKVARTVLSKLLFKCLVQENSSVTSETQHALSTHMECEHILDNLHKAVKLHQNTKGASEVTVSTESAITVLALLFNEVVELKDPSLVEINWKHLRFSLILHDLAKHLATDKVHYYYDEILTVLSKCQLLGFVLSGDFHYVVDYPKGLMMKNKIKPAILLAFSLQKAALFHASEDQERLAQLIWCPLAVFNKHHDNIYINSLPETTMKNLQKPSFLLLSVHLLMKLPQDLSKEMRNAEALLTKLSSNVTSGSAVHSQLHTASLNWLASLLQFQCQRLNEKEIIKIFNLCSQFTKGTSPVVDAAFKCMTMLLKHMPLPKLLGEMQQCLERSLSEMQWEVRDSGLQTISILGQASKDSQDIARWLECSPLPGLVMQCTRDGEAYVRASAVATLQQLVILPPLQKMTDDVFARCRQLVRLDTEAIVRRAAIETMCKIARLFYKNDAVQHSLISQCMKDMDWQVKLCIVNHCGSVINSQSTVPSYASTLISPTEPEHQTQLLFERLCNDGYIFALFTGLHDCDLTVQYQSCKVLNELKSLSESISFPQSGDLNTSSVGPQTNKDTSDHIKAFMASVANCANPVEMHNLVLNYQLPDLQTLSDASIDTYVNPMSMLQDLLVAMKSHEENQVIDCY